MAAPKPDVSAEKLLEERQHRREYRRSLYKQFDFVITYAIIMGIITLSMNLPKLISW